jgi:2-polyprenyl-6-methoxyphenol hydroxylase-like FAD-dependent oxidoreductase
VAVTSGPQTASVNKYASPNRRIALIGDATVGMYSRLGQGVASSAERASLLIEAGYRLSSSDDSDQMIGFPEALHSFSDEGNYFEPSK